MEFNNMELMEVISKPFAKSEDIVKLLHCSIPYANKIRAAIESEILQEGKKLPCKGYAVPMDRLLKYLMIDEKRVVRMAKAESEIYRNIARLQVYEEPKA